MPITCLKIGIFRLSARRLPSFSTSVSPPRFLHLVYILYLCFFPLLKQQKREITVRSLLMPVYVVCPCFDEEFHYNTYFFFTERYMLRPIRSSSGVRFVIWWKMLPFPAVAVGIYGTRCKKDLSHDKGSTALFTVLHTTLDDGHIGRNMWCDLKILWERKRIFKIYFERDMLHVRQMNQWRFVRILSMPKNKCTQLPVSGTKATCSYRHKEYFIFFGLIKSVFEMWSQLNVLNMCSRKQHISESFK
jgi:hypothetical protein